MNKYKPYSFSKVSTFYQCPYKFKLKYIDKIKVPFETNIALEKGRYLHHLIEKKFLNENTKDFKFSLSKQEDIEKYHKIFEDFKNNPFIDNLNKLDIEVEKGFSIDIENNEIKVGNYNNRSLMRGYIDFLGIYEKNDKKNCIIIDWKSGKVPKEPNILQVEIYALWCFLYYDVEVINTCFYYIEHNIKKCFKFQKADIPYLKQRIIDKIGYIENENEFRKQPSALCDYCEMYKFGHCNGDNQKKFYF